MTCRPASTEAPDHGGYVVGKPRATDAVAGSLRDAYRTDQPLPIELAALLARLNCVATT